MEFWMERTPEHSHAGATGFKPPKGVTIHQIPPEKSIGSMMLSGELHATLLYVVNANLIDRSKADLSNHPDIRPLFPDADAEGARYYAKTGIYPINHGMVVKREIAERHPWVILNLLKAFERAREIADSRRLAHLDDHFATGAIPSSIRAALAKPMIKHGMVANRKILETAAQYSHEQGLTPRVLKLEEIFARSTLNQ
jgi:4,5-dihydroxyphthalate decarboxylase